MVKTLKSVEDKNYIYFLDFNVSIPQFMYIFVNLKYLFNSLFLE